MPVVKQVYQVKITINDEVKFGQRPVEVRRLSELNGLINNQRRNVDVGDKVVIEITREV